MQLVGQVIRDGEGREVAERFIGGSVGKDDDIARMTAALGQAIPILSLLTVVLWLAAVRMTPALRAADDETRRPAVVVTATAIVARHGGAMRTWFFADLLCAHLSAQGGRMDLGLITNAGTRSFIDCAALESGGRLVEAVAVHLPIVTI